MSQMRSFVKPSKVNIHLADNALLVYRNNVKELVIKGETSDLKAVENYFRKTLKRDYAEFVDFYNLEEDTHLATYLLNTITIDQNLAELLSKVKTIVKGKK